MTAAAQTDPLPPVIRWIAACPACGALTEWRQVVQAWSSPVSPKPVPVGACCPKERP